MRTVFLALACRKKPPSVRAVKYPDRTFLLVYFYFIRAFASNIPNK